MPSDFIRLPVIGLEQEVILDQEIANSLPSASWYFMGGRVIAVFDPAFIEMIDLANFVGGGSCSVAASMPLDYRRSALQKVKASIALDGTLKVSIESLEN